jgi:hypothetical protein
MANSVTVGTLQLAATFNSVSIEAFYADDDNANATCTVQYRPLGTTTWLNVDSYRYTETAGTAGTQRAFYAKVHYLKAGVTYQVQATFADADGVTGGPTVTGNVTTRAENIVAAASLVPTHYVSPTGSDANAGTSAGAPWRSLAKVMFQARASVTDMVVRFAPGRYYAPLNSTRSYNIMPQPNVSITLFAQNAAVQEQTVVIGGKKRIQMNAANAGNRSIVEPRSNIDNGPAVFGPTGAADADLVVGATWTEATSTSATSVRTNTITRIAPWTQVTVRGADGVDRTVWKAAGMASGSTDSQLLCYGTTRDGNFTRMPVWYGKGNWTGGTLGTQANHPGTWAQSALNSRHFKYGALIMEAASVAYTENGGATTTNTTDIFAIMPSDSTGNPNDYYWKESLSTGNRYGLKLAGSEGSKVRASGFDFCGLSWPTSITTDTSGGITSGGNPTTQIWGDDVTIDHCLFRNYYVGFWIATAITPNVYAHRTLIQYNRFEANRVVAEVGPSVANDGIICPWSWIKDTPIHTPELGAQAAKAGSNEIGCIGGNAWPQYAVVRYNTVEGGFDFCNDFYVDTRYDRYTGYGSDIHDNIIRRTGDDVIDLSRHKINVSIFDNRCEHVASVWSQAPNWSGPTFYLNNEVWRYGNAYRGRLGTPFSDIGYQVPHAVYVKYSNGSPQGLFVMINNVAWTDQVTWDPCPGIFPEGGSGTPNPRFVLKNNILRCTDTILDYRSSQSAGQWVEDHNVWTVETGHATRPLFRTELHNVDTYSTFKTDTGQGTGSNPSISETSPIDALLVDPVNGDLRVRYNATLTTAGVTVGSVATSATPSMGAFQPRTIHKARRRLAALGGRSFG